MGFLNNSDINVTVSDIISVEQSDATKLKGTMTTDSTQAGRTSSASITRPADTTAYAVNDVVSSTPTAVMVFSDVYGVSGSSIIVNRIEFEMDTNAVATGTGSFKLHIYNDRPTSIADNVAFNLPSADRAKYMGWIDIDTPVDIGDTCYISVQSVNFQCKLATGSTTLYGILTTSSIFTPVSATVHKVTIHTLGV